MCSHLWFDMTTLCGNEKHAHTMPNSAGWFIFNAESDEKKKFLLFSDVLTFSSDTHFFISMLQQQFIGHWTVIHCFNCSKEEE